MQNKTGNVTPLSSEECPNQLVATLHSLFFLMLLCCRQACIVGERKEMMEIRALCVYKNVTSLVVYLCFLRKKPNREHLPYYEIYSYTCQNIWQNTAVIAIHEMLQWNFSKLR